VNEAGDDFPRNRQLFRIPKTLSATADSYFIGIRRFE
jgi:hypothetical protein